MKPANMNFMPRTVTNSMIRREIGDDKVCLLTFDRPESGANIFDAATLERVERTCRSYREGLVAARLDHYLGQEIDLHRRRRSEDAFETGANRRVARVHCRRASAFLIALPRSRSRPSRRFTALRGGGYEITLACDYRVASDDPATRIGLAGNDARFDSGLGRCDAFAALDRRGEGGRGNFEGKIYSAEDALDLGLVDEVVPRDQLLEARVKSWPRENASRQSDSLALAGSRCRATAIPRRHALSA